MRVGRGARPRRVRDSACSVPGNRRHAGRVRQPLRGRLVAERFELLGRRADELDAGGLARARERGVLGQESVAGMDRVDALLLAPRR